MTMRETMTRLTRLTTLLTLLALLAPAAASADSIELAKRHYKLGEEMFNRADYAGAIVQFKAAYENSKKPALLYNIARCQESLGQHAEAIKTYETYLGSKPRDAEQIKARISNLRRLVQQKTPAPTPAPAPTPSPTPAPASVPPETSTVTPSEMTPETGTGRPNSRPPTPGAAARCGAGSPSAQAARCWSPAWCSAPWPPPRPQELEEGYRDGKEFGDLQDSVDAGESLQTGQIVTLIAGGAALAAGVVLLYLHYGRGEKADEGETKESDDDLASVWLAPMAASGGAYLGGGFSF